MLTHAIDLQMFKIEVLLKFTEKTFGAEFSSQELSLVHQNAQLDGQVIIIVWNIIVKKPYHTHC